MEATSTFEHAERRSWRPLALSAIGPLTVLAGIVWAIAQPYRVTLFDARGVGIWDMLVQPPLLVVAVGLLFHLLVAKPLARLLEDGR